MIVALILVSAFLHAAWNAMLKREANKDRTLIAAVCLAALLAIAVALVRGGVPFPTLPSFVWAIVAGAFEQMYFYGLSRALDRGPLGPVYTISRGGAVLIVYPLSILLFGEGVTALSIAGSALVLFGLVMSGLRTRGDKAMSASATGWAIACACAIAAYHLAYKASLEAGGASSAVFAASLGFATLINFVRTSDRRAVAKLLVEPRVLLMGALCGGSFLILIEALATGGAGFALTLRNTSVLFAVGLAWAIGERPRLAAALGAAFVAAGAIAMAL